jgi:hypothetical protein
MNVLLLHGSGWDEFLLLGVTILVAVVIIRLTTRGSGSGPDDSTTP